MCGWIGHCYPFSSVQFRRSVLSDSLRPHGLQHGRLPCPSPTSRAYSNSCPSVMPSNHLILYCPLLLSPSVKVRMCSEYIPLCRTETKSRYNGVHSSSVFLRLLDFWKNTRVVLSLVGILKLQVCHLALFVCFGFPFLALCFKEMV